MKDFTDHFKRQSGIYSQVRPHYPDALFEFLSSLVPAHDLAWDAGTGNGQAAIGLANHFKKVIATDPAEEQIKHAYPDQRIEYKIQRAEFFDGDSNSLDLITCANALHWFEFDAFYKNVNRLLKPNGILAAWAYGVPSVSAEIDKVTKHLHDVVVNDFWAEPNRLVDKEYTTLPFPYPLIQTPDFSSQRELNLEEFVTYFNTWSATQKFIAAKAFNPTDNLKRDLLPLWGDVQSKRAVTWKLILKVGRK